MAFAKLRWINVVCAQCGPKSKVAITAGVYMSSILRSLLA